MDLLITVLGNAVVHQGFRDKLLKGDPVKEAEKWGFRLTKGDQELLRQIFIEDAQHAGHKAELQRTLECLETSIYRQLPCGKPCNMSVLEPQILVA